MGWCSAGSSGEQCGQEECEAVGGTYSPTKGGGGCESADLVPDPFARELVESSVWPPVIKVRDAILPSRRAGARMVADFDRHYPELVSIMKRNPKLLLDVIRYSSAMGAYLRAVGGQKTPDDGSLSSYTSGRLRPGMVEWTADILATFEAGASEALKATIGRYKSVLPSLQNLTPAELLAALDDRQLVAKLQAA